VGIAEPVVRLGDLLGFKELGLELVTGGTDAAGRRVLGAHSIEVERPSRFMAPDWLMLTTGMRLRGHAAAQRELIDELEDAGLAGLGLGLGIIFQRVPRALAEAAAERSFPIVSVPLETPFREIVGVINRALLSGDLRALQRLTSLQRYLTDALREDDPAATMLERLGSVTDATALVFGPGGHVEAASGDAPADALWAALGDRSAENIVEVETDGWRAVAVDTGRDGDAPRRLVLAHRGPEPPSRLTRQALQATAPLLAAVARLDDVAHTQEQAIRGALLDDMLRGGTAAELRALAARAAPFGLDFSRPARIVLLAPRPRGDAGDVHDRRDALEAVLLRAQLPHLIGSSGRGVVALVQGAPHDVVAPIVDGDEELVAGIGRPAPDVATVPHSMRDAELAVERVGHEFEQRLLEFEDFDLGTLLISEAPRQRIAPKVEELRTLLHAHPLLYEALVAWFEHDLDISAAAASLHLHANSLRYRLSRIERLIGRSLRKPSTITALYVVITMPA
jgi:Purine catabolism regulatory protein-like family/PucR C-terminal helix-turn-helix domain/GGDEF-like domain